MIEILVENNKSKGQVDKRAAAHSVLGLCASNYSNVLEDLSKLMDHIPLDSDIPSNAKLMKDNSIDSPIPIAGTVTVADTVIERFVTFRVVLRFLIRTLRRSITTGVIGSKQNDGWQVLINDQRLKQLRELGFPYPMGYLLFDFCLTLLDRDLTDARLFLAHCLHILGLDRSVNLLLSVLINEGLTNDADSRELVTILAKLSEPRNAKEYFDTFGLGFKHRYKIYQQEIQRFGLS